MKHEIPLECTYEGKDYSTFNADVITLHMDTDFIKGLCGDTNVKVTVIIETVSKRDT